MQNEPYDNEDDKPLDPVLEKVRKKMIRLLAVSLGIMFAGIMALLVAVVYKANSGEDENVAQSTFSANAQSAISFSDELEVILPLGFDIKSFDLDGSRGSVLGVSSDGVERVLIIDLTDGKILSDIVLRK